MSIKVFVRHCFYSHNSDNNTNPDKVRPKGFNQELVYKNLKRTSKKYDLDITYLLDVKYRNDKTHFLENDPSNKIIEHTGGTDATSFTNLLNYVKELNLDDNDIVYFAEDDYLHIDDWPVIMQDAFDIPAVDYVTLYDHNDKYGLLPMYDSLTSKIYCGKQSHWRIIPNTTNTYAMKYMTLMNSIDIHLKYSKEELVWTRDAEKFGDLSSRGYILVSPMPGWSTHLENAYMSPLIDWEELLATEELKSNAM